MHHARVFRTSVFFVHRWSATARVRSGRSGLLAHLGPFVSVVFFGAGWWCQHAAHESGTWSTHCPCYTRPCSTDDFCVCFLLKLFHGAPHTILFHVVCLPLFIAFGSATRYSDVTSSVVAELHVVSSYLCDMSPTVVCSVVPFPHMRCGFEACQHMVLSMCLCRICPTTCVLCVASLCLMTRLVGSCLPTHGLAHVLVRHEPNRCL